MIAEDKLEPNRAAKKRLLMTGLLTLGAFGTHWLPGRTIVPMDSRQQRSAVSLMDTKLMTGPNSLLGDVVGDQAGSLLASKSLASPDLSREHIEVKSVVDLAGENQLLCDMSPVSTELSNSDYAAAITDTSAVPESKTAGVFLLAAAPMVLVRRKGRVGKYS